MSADTTPSPQQQNVGPSSSGQGPGDAKPTPAASGGRTALFFVAATVFSILITLVLMAIFVVLIILALGSNANPNTFQILLFVSFIVAMVLSFWIYGRVMKWATVKYKLDKRVPQLFTRKKK